MKWAHHWLYSSTTISPIFLLYSILNTTKYTSFSSLILSEHSTDILTDLSKITPRSSVIANSYFTAYNCICEIGAVLQSALLCFYQQWVSDSTLSPSYEMWSCYTILWQSLPLKLPFIIVYPPLSGHSWTTQAALALTLMSRRLQCSPSLQKPIVCTYSSSEIQCIKKNIVCNFVYCIVCTVPTSTFPLNPRSCLRASCRCLGYHGASQHVTQHAYFQTTASNSFFPVS